MKTTMVMALVLLGAWTFAVAAEDKPAPGAAVAAESATETATPATWANSPIGRPDFFPLCVWLQRVDKIAAYKAIGINTYVATWQGPNEEELAALKAGGMYFVSDMNEVALKHLDDPTIIAWIHDDEPDNAREMEKFWKNDLEAVKKAWPDLPEKSLEKWGQYGPPMSPKMIQDRYKEIKAKDATRPVWVGCGQGVAWEAYKGRGVRTGKLEDYPEYIKGGDIVSFDIYPVVHKSPEVKGKLEYVARGIDRLMTWTEGRKPVYSAIECTRIGNAEVKPTPEQTKTEVWMAIVHGARGILYFCHQFAPTRISAGLLADEEMCKMVAEVNRQITQLAPVLNSPTAKDAATVASSNADVPIDILVKRQGDDVYIFAVAMRDAAAKGTFTVAGATGGKVEVLGENRTIDLADGKFADEFKGYDVHLYKVTPAK
ncbi:MAG: hypothetical protein JXL80_03160 [Planctomycetes bacterium]|nr:hypothetical protein [Planctomycetota bacterium]